MKKHLLSIVAGLIFVSVAAAAEEPAVAVPEWKAGVASVVITPQRPIQMAGYANRQVPPD